MWLIHTNRKRLTRGEHCFQPYDSWCRTLLLAVVLLALDLSAQDFGAPHGYGALKKMKVLPQQFDVRKDEGLSEVCGLHGSGVTARGAKEKRHKHPFLPLISLSLSLSLSSNANALA
ncbi:hypothetical protein E2542_SST28047 [Spatholobus suberectus]|nr:hypothetical protein E2542_SST28047 [Spatholobus suberectus]